MDLQKLRVEVFYPQQIEDSQLDRYNRLFDLWYQIWVETRREVNPSLPTPSDNFSRQDEVIGLFYEDRPIATICHRYVDLQQRCIMHDSFFTGLWTDQVKESLAQHGRWFVLGSHVFIDPEFRKMASGYPTKNILCQLSFHRLNFANVDGVIGLMRKDKGMHDVFYKAGAKPLIKDVQFYQIPVDIVMFHTAKQSILIDAADREVIDPIVSQSPNFLNHQYFVQKQMRRNYVETIARSMHAKAG